MLTTRPSHRALTVLANLPDGSALAGRLSVVTSSPREALSGADLVIICVPHSDMQRTLVQIAPHLRRDTLVGAVPGFGGFGFAARRLIPRVHCIFGTQRIPFVVRRYVSHACVEIGGIRRQMFLATMPAARALSVAELIQHIIGIPTVPVSHFINIELSPSNSIVNPARLFSLFGPSARRRPRAKEEFFRHWDTRASRTLLQIDQEVQTARRLIPRDTSFVTPILVQYDANNVATLTRRIRNLRALGGRPIPVRQSAGEPRLDLKSTFVRDDIDRGLIVVRNILSLAGADTPVMDKIIAWRCSLGRPARPIHAAHDNETIESLVSLLD